MKKIALAALLALAGVAHAAVPSSFQRTPVGGGAVVRPATRWIDNVVLSANTDKTYTVPSAAGAAWAIIGSDCAFWARPNATAAIPSGDVTDGSGSAYGPIAWTLEGVQTIHFIAGATCHISIELFKG